MAVVRALNKTCLFFPKFNLDGAFLDLLMVLKAKRSTYVKPRDLRKYLGIQDHHRISRLGEFLNILARGGYAIRWNNARPHRYTLIPKPLWLEVIERCNGSFTCESCPLRGVCPFMKVKEVIGND